MPWPATSAPLVLLAAAALRSAGVPAADVALLGQRADRVYVDSFERVFA